MPAKGHAIIVHLPVARRRHGPVGGGSFGAREDRFVEGLYEGGGVAEREHGFGGREGLTQGGGSSRHEGLDFRGINR